MPDFNVVEVEIFAEHSAINTASYEVIDPNKETVGRFASLKEAERFMELLRHIG